jgi:hypothetical protein
MFGLYATDALVRRAEPLQVTSEGLLPEAGLVGVSVRVMGKTAEVSHV